MRLERLACMKTLAAALVLALACSGERQPATNTITPAESRPARTTTADMTHTALATAGSPPPASAPAPGTTFVTVTEGGIEVPRLLPRGHTVFHVQNQTGAAHEIAVRGATGSVTAPLPAKGRSVIQLLVDEKAYVITCTIPGHQEHTRFETYVPGTSLVPRKP
jgi:hypothetical protein